MFGGGGDQPAGQAVPGSGLNLRKSAPVGGRTNESGPRTGSGETRSGSQPGPPGRGWRRGGAPEASGETKARHRTGGGLEAGSAGAEQIKI